MLQKRMLTLLVLIVLGLMIGLIPTLGQDYNESPVLAEMVAAGDLPPVAERLPVEPMVVPVLESIGQYGGTWRFGLSGGADNFFLQRTIYYEPLLRWTPNWDGWIPNVAESLDINEDATEFTFKLREGMKWSDGVPFTADDIMFWYEDMLMNEEYTPAVPADYRTGDTPVVVEKIDDTTVVFRFADSFGFFPLRMAMTNGLGPVTAPKHYLSQFHPAYNENAVALAEDAGYATWVDYMGFLSEDTGVGNNPDLPTLTAWKMTAPYPGGDTVIFAERNPYYWKVDEAGNQLPYIDRVQMFVAEEVDALVLQALNGDIDMQSRHIGTLDNKPIFFDSQEEGDYRIFDLVSTWGNAYCMFFNHSHPDPMLRDIFQNKDFRIGLSHAIDRQEIIDLIYLSQGTASQFAPHLDGPFANEQMSFQYTEYDVDLANEYLDRVLPEKDSQGFRLMPNGERLFITADVSPAPLTELADGMELVKQYWAEVGVDLNVSIIDRSIQWERKAANQSEIFLWAAGGGGGLDVLLNVQSYFPDRGAAWQAPAWGDWYASNGAEGEEPPENVRTMMEMYRELLGIADPARQIEVMNEIVQMSADWFPQVCITTQPNLFGIVKNNMHNVPDIMIQSATWPDPAPTNPETYYFSNN